MTYLNIIYVVKHPLLREVHDERFADIVYVVAALDALCQGSRKVAGSNLVFVCRLCSSWVGVDHCCGANAVRSLASEPFDTGIHDVFWVDLFRRLFPDLDDRRFCHQAIQKTTGYRCGHARVTDMNFHHQVRLHAR